MAFNDKTQPSKYLLQKFNVVAILGASLDQDQTAQLVQANL